MNVREWEKIKNDKNSKEYKTNGINSLEYTKVGIEKTEHYLLVKVKL